MVGFGLASTAQRRPDGVVEMLPGIAGTVEDPDTSGCNLYLGSNLEQSQPDGVHLGFGPLGTLQS
jgi:hypothetical protein